MNDKLLIIISSAEKQKVLTGMMYALNARKYKWVNSIKLLFFGPSEKLLTENEELQQMLTEFHSLGELSISCKFIAEKYGIEENLEILGSKVEYVGEIISNSIKEGYIPMVW